MKKSIFLHTLLLLLALADVKAQPWTQIGTDIDGVGEDNWLGYSVSLSATGAV